jgi:beta-glucosidase/6-phospho-beta-glucosidase/beta-galactosidase
MQWREGYTQRFGITHVAFNTPDLKRTVKDSGRFLSKNFFTVGKDWLKQPQQPAIKA